MGYCNDDLARGLIPDKTSLNTLVWLWSGYGDGDENRFMSPGGKA